MMLVLIDDPLLYQSDCWALKPPAQCVNIVQYRFPTRNHQHNVWTGLETTSTMCEHCAIQVSHSKPPAQCVNIVQYRFPTRNHQHNVWTGLETTSTMCEHCAIQVSYFFPRSRARNLTVCHFWRVTQSTALGISIRPITHWPLHLPVLLVSSLGIAAHPSEVNSHA